MAESGIGLDQDAFCCSICLDLLKEPVTIPCGHSYCMSCIHSHWDEELTKTNYSCPQCRQKFSQRPVLVKNTMLAVLMEGLKKTAALSSAAAAVKVEDSCATKGDYVVCDLCNDKKQKAVKSCLQCLVSYCKVHLQPHYNVAALKKHKLVDPTVNLLEHICSRHDEVMKMFCRTDQQCICYLCSVDVHKGHDTVTAAAERADKQKELGTVQQKIKQVMTMKSQNRDLLTQEKKNIESAECLAMEKIDKIFKVLMGHIEKKRGEIKQEIRSQKKADEHRLEGLEDKLSQDITELKGKLTELEELKHTEDHYKFLHDFSKLSKVCEEEPKSTLIKTGIFRPTVLIAVAKMQKRVDEFCALDLFPNVETPKVIAPKPESYQVPQVGDVKPASPQTLEERPSLPSHSNKLKPKAIIFQIPQPVKKLSAQPPKMTKQELETYIRDLTLDPRSLNNKLKLSRENHVVKHMPQSQSYNPHPFRFTDFPQVVSKQSLTGCCFWRITMTMGEVFTVAVAYKDIQRDGPSNECCFGKNDKSWALECFKYHCVFWHNNQSTEIPVIPWGKLGIFLDYKAGILSFYYYQNFDLHHIYTVRTTFTRPLVAGFRLDEVGSLGGPGDHFFDTFRP